MNVLIHRADSRGRSENDWLTSRHTFSFSGYHDPSRMNFGALRVLNDDIVAPSGGFGTHPHDNMEIVSIPLQGTLRHKDSMGNTHVISQGEVQIMSAGTGLTHSEFNDSAQEPVNFLQIWVLPRELNIAPRYGQLSYAPTRLENRFQLLVSPERSDDTLWINQDAFFSLGDITRGTGITYHLKRPGNGAYVLVIDGEIAIGEHVLEARDGIGIEGAAEFILNAISPSRVLVIDVPLDISHGAAS